MSPDDFNYKTVVENFESDLKVLRRAPAAPVGRGVELANTIDRLQCALDAIKGELFCPYCSARLTSAV